MKLSAEEFERIVQEVVRRLLELHASTPGSKPAGSTLTLEDRVVAMESIRGRLEGVSRVCVARRAVVTPAVKDELRERKVTLHYRES